jgi:hypothetical protein
MFETLAQVLLAGLHLWENEEKTKYIDRLMDLRKRRYDEENKPDDSRSDAVLDDLEFQLRNLGIAFATGAGQPNTSSQSGKANG